MFIELAEFLRCPTDHPETHCVVAPHAMVGRDVLTGIVGCPACRQEYPIVDGVVRFGEQPEMPDSSSLPQPSVVQALLGIATPGGYVVLVGSAASLGRDFGESISGVHMVAINVLPSFKSAPGMSVLAARATVPLRTGMARGVVLGGELVGGSWSSEAARVLLPGLRLVSLGPAPVPPDIEKLAADGGLWVGKKGKGG